MIAIALVYVWQHTVYNHKSFVRGLRSCSSQPKCVIGGACNSECVCSQGNRHKASDAKLLERQSTHAEQSTRQKYHTGKSSSASGGAQALEASDPAANSADSGGDGPGLDAGEREPWEEHQAEVVVRDEVRINLSGMINASLGDEDGAREPDLDPSMDF